MKIISKVEINYFRSVYSCNLLHCNDVNVLIGGNDSGKSNILKALNLFFNNQTELNTPFNFYDDLSRLREKEARSAKGRAFLWIKVTFNNFLGWKSLPSQFSIKRTWNRYGDRPVDSYSQDLPSTTVSRFLNKISFHYIPAVRGRDIFTHYLNALHDALIDDEKAGVRLASTNLLDAINLSTLDMSEKINTGLKIESSIQVPEDLRELFTALDFSTKFSGYDIPLQKRGDGIQARHIPFILDFIARHTSRKHIWAYEEPESSLEMSKAFELARQFEVDFSKENQIFLTTHSPAFYDLEGPNVNKWLVSSSKYLNEEADEVVDFHTTVNEVHIGEDADESLGIAALLASRAKELYLKIAELNKSHEALQEHISHSSRAQVIVEGPTDRVILETAFAKLYPGENLFCEFISADGADNLTHSLKSFKTLDKAYPFPIIGLYDNDQKGRNQYKDFNKYKFVENGDSFREINADKRLFCGLLPVPEEVKNAAAHYKEEAGLDLELPLCIEFMFSEEVINRAIKENILKLKKTQLVIKNNTGMQLPLNFSEAAKQFLPANSSYLACEIDSSSKNAFATWVSNLDQEAFSVFEPLFEILRRLSI